MKRVEKLAEDYAGPQGRTPTFAAAQEIYLERQLKIAAFEAGFRRARERAQFLLNSWAVFLAEEGDLSIFPSQAALFLSNLGEEEME